MTIWHLFGRRGGDTCLTNPMPLPSPGTDQWCYGSLARPAFATRALYHARYAPTRAAHLAVRVREYRPALVVFFSTSSWCRRWWAEIAGGAFTPDSAAALPYFHAHDGKTQFLIALHPNAHGVTNDYFYTLGRRHGA